MSCLITNSARSFGGQEQYLVLLGGELAGMGVTGLRFLGGPAQLADKLVECGFRPSDATERSDVVLLNGNRALYESLRHPVRGDCVVYVQHSSFADQQAGWWRRMVRAVLLRLALRRVDAVVRVCNAAIPDGWCGDRLLRTVYNGVDLSQFPCKSQWSDPSSVVRLLMVGAVNDNKNQRLAIEALQHMPNAALTIVGDGPLKSGLQALAESLGVGERVRWAGVHADPAVFYREADVYLMLSRFEAMPFVMLEAMASGTPVVGFAVGGVAEVVEHGVNGYLLEERSPVALASALRELASQPGRLAQLGQAARTRIESGFTVQHMARGFMDVVADARQRKGLPLSWGTEQTS